jgi:GTP-binding protein HflX
MTKKPVPTKAPKERAFLVGVELNRQGGLLSVEESLNELSLLADTAGLDVVGSATQRLDHPDPKTYIRSGKVLEIKDLAEDLVADIVLFDDELSPRHQRELEKAFGNSMRVLDRSALILDIFAQHADTREGSLQVELAQYEYRLPRLTRAWTHLARQAGGGGGRSGSVGGVGLRGPGEKQIEVDRREIQRRISTLKDEIEKVRAHRSRYRARRTRAAIPTVAIVGYTNAGKSTLLNRLAQADVYVADELFATLDPTTRRVQLPKGQHILATDTVGFIQKLPTTLVAAFQATLEEIVEADMLLHVVDISHPRADAQSDSVHQTLQEIDAGELPVVTALNKVDLLASDEEVPYDIDDYDRAVPISAKRGQGIDALLATLENELYGDPEAIEVRLPYKQGRLINLFHKYGNVHESRHYEDSVVLVGEVPEHMLVEFVAFQIDENEFDTHDSLDSLDGMGMDPS